MSEKEQARRDLLLRRNSLAVRILYALRGEVEAQRLEAMRRELEKLDNELRQRPEVTETILRAAS